MRRNTLPLWIVSLGLLEAPLWAQSGASLQFRSASEPAPTAAASSSEPAVRLGLPQPAVRLGKPRAYTARAQTPDTTPILAAAVAQAPFDWIMPAESTATASQPPRIWGSAEYLLFWFKDQNVAIPMVTSAPAGAINPGAINSPNTTVLFGSQDIEFEAANGLRLTLGGWLDACANYGIEGSGFGFERKAQIYNFTSNGNPTLALPFFNLSTNTESALAVASPALTVPASPGQVEISSNIKLWGTEINGVVNLTRSSGLDADLLAGVRYLDLAEGLYLSAARQGVGAFVLQDSFATSNHFLGGQIGARVTGTWERFFATATAKLALGATQEKIEIDGYLVRTPPGAASNGGLYTQVSNSGEFTRTQFAILPEIDLKLGVKITQNFRATVGYNFMWLSNVVRPGDQLNRNVNLTQNPAFGGNPAAPIGPRGPTVPFQDSSFWAQGVTAGIEFLY